MKWKRRTRFQLMFQKDLRKWKEYVKSLIDAKDVTVLLMFNILGSLPSKIWEVRDESYHCSIVAPPDLEK